MIVTMLFAAWGGMKLDAHFQNKKPWFTIFLLLFGVISSIYFVIRGLMNGNE
jgi:F0F1-type ATP synthase assembly protein I